MKTLLVYVSLLVLLLAPSAQAQDICTRSIDEARETFRTREAAWQTYARAHREDLARDRAWASLALLLHEQIQPLVDNLTRRIDGSFEGSMLYLASQRVYE